MNLFGKKFRDYVKRKMQPPQRAKAVARTLCELGKDINPGMYQAKDIAAAFRTLCYSNPNESENISARRETCRELANLLTDYHGLQGPDFNGNFANALPLWRLWIKRLFKKTDERHTEMRKTLFREHEELIWWQTDFHIKDK